MAKTWGKIFIITITVVMLVMHSRVIWPGRTVMRTMDSSSRDSEFNFQLRVLEAKASPWEGFGVIANRRNVSRDSEPDSEKLCGLNEVALLGNDSCLDWTMGDVSVCVFLAPPESHHRLEGVVNAPGASSLPWGSHHRPGGIVIAPGESSLPRGHHHRPGGIIIAPGASSSPRGHHNRPGGIVIAPGESSLPRGSRQCPGGIVIAPGESSLPRGSRHCPGGVVISLDPAMSLRHNSS
ncbi:unnamed protein product [Lampetra fluviatilis]